MALKSSLAALSLVLTVFGGAEAAVTAGQVDYIRITGAANGDFEVGLKDDPKVYVLDRSGSSVVPTLLSMAEMARTTGASLVIEWATESGNERTITAMEVR